MPVFKPHPVYPMSGQITLGVSGSVSAFPTLDAHRVYLAAHPDNTGIIWVGNESGTVNGNNGYPLEASIEGLALEGLGRLGVLYATPDIAGETVCWLLLDETPAYDDTP